MADFTPKEQDKILRAMKRVKFSILADREIQSELEIQKKIGADGFEARLSLSLSDLSQDSD